MMLPDDAKEAIQEFGNEFAGLLDVVAEQCALIEELREDLEEMRGEA